MTAGTGLPGPAEKALVRVGRAAVGLLILAALGYDFWRVSVQFHQTAGNYFSYFTIQSNLFAAAVLLWGAVRPTGRPELRAVLRGAAVVYLLITGIVYALLLEHLHASVVPWVNFTLHRLAPVVLVLDWLLDPPGRAITWRRALLWLVYAPAYVGYTLLRGLATGWYPYPFINPAQPGGYATVAAWCGGITALGLVLTVLLALSGRRVRRPAG
jgi:hypothetical protein